MTVNNENDEVRLQWWKICIGLAIAYSPNFLNRIARSFGASWGWLRGPQSVLVWNWIVVVGLLIHVVVVERRHLGSIGMTKPARKDLSWALVFWAVSVVASGVVHTWFPPPSTNGLEVILALPVPVIVLIVLTTSITEEVFYRGYAIERLRELSGSLAFAVVVSLILFLIPHIAFFGPHWLVSQGLGVVLLYVLYVWRRNLYACMVMHLLGNLMILFPALGLE